MIAISTSSLLFLETLTQCGFPTWMCIRIIRKVCSNTACWALPQSFWFRRFRVKAEYKQVPRSCWCCWSGNHTWQATKETSLHCYLSEEIVHKMHVMTKKLPILVHITTQYWMNWCWKLHYSYLKEILELLLWGDKEVWLSKLSSHT